MEAPKVSENCLWQILFILSLLLGTFGLASQSEAASVYNCSASVDKCVIKLEEGIVGDRVKVLDEKARVVAHGRILKRRGSFAVISIGNLLRNIRKGYPVIVEVENRDSSLQWAASFSNER
jgi:hypothetical protein